MLFLSKITILHIFDRFEDHTTKKRITKNSPHEASQTSTQ